MAEGPFELHGNRPKPPAPESRAAAGGQVCIQGLKAGAADVKGFLVGLKDKITEMQAIGQFVGRQLPAINTPCDVVLPSGWGEKRALEMKAVNI
jgi:hypothetical protein